MALKNNRTNTPVTPGVYTVEFSAEPAVVAVSTSVPVFIGYTQKTLPANNGIMVHNMDHYRHHFGTAGDLADGPLLPPFLLYYCMNYYFLNGGGPAYIVSIGDYSKFTAENGARPFINAVDKLDNLKEPALLLMPDGVNLEKEDYLQVLNHALAHCRNHPLRFLLLDVPQTTLDSTNAGRIAFQAEVNDFRSRLATQHLESGAAYTPYLSGTTEQARILLVPPACVMAAQFTRADLQVGVWKAPSGLTVDGDLEPVQDIDDNLQEELNSDPDGLPPINTIRYYDGIGTTTWSARTLADRDSPFRHIAARRTASMMESSIRNYLNHSRLETNTQYTWDHMKRGLRSFLTDLWKAGALQGRQESAAFNVRVGLGETMSEADIEAGLLILEIDAALLRPTEFITLHFTRKMVS